MRHSPPLVTNGVRVSVYLSRWGGTGWKAHLLNHWNIAPLIRYQSGLPVNPATGKDNSLTGVGNDRPDVISMQTYTGAPHGLFYQYVNPNLFAANQLGSFGNAGHFSLRGPGYFNVDVAGVRQVWGVTIGAPATGLQRASAHLQRPGGRRAPHRFLGL